MKNSVQDFLDNFKYKIGIAWLDGYRVLRKNSNGKYVGDCDDFATTIAYKDAGNIIALLWGILTFKYVFWYVKSPQNGAIPRHMAIWIRGQGWIDGSTNKKQSSRFRSKPSPDKLVFPLNIWIVWVPLRMLQGWIWGLFFGR